MPNKTKKTKRTLPIRGLKRAAHSEKLSDVAKALRVLGGLGGSKVGGFIGGPPGAEFGRTLGTSAGAFISKLTGHGAYKLLNAEKVKRNSLINNTSAPRFSLGSEGVRICHREYLMDVSSTVDFAYNVFPINPGQSKTFPWLCNIAENFQEYIINGLLIEFKSTSAQIYSSTNTSMGVIVMSFSYDAIRPPFTNKVLQLNADWAVDIRPDLSTLAPMECAKGSNPLTELYVRPDSLSTVPDIHTYDMANFQISTVGSQVENVVGELFITYDVTFKKASIIDDKLSHFSHYNLGTTVTLPSKPFGIVLPMLGTTMELSFDDSTKEITLPYNISSGNFVVTYSLYCNPNTNLTAPIITALTNCVTINYYSSATNSFVTPIAANSTQSNLISTFSFKVTGPSAKLLLVGGVCSNAALLDGDLQITQLPVLVG